MNRQNIIRSISSSLPTVWHNATKFGVNQILMAITLASISGISRICRIAAFSGDGLVKSLLRLKKGIKENAISATLKNLEDLLKTQKWTDVKGLKDVAIFEFDYRAKSWQRSRMLKAIRSFKEYVEVSYLGEKKIVPVYQYVCYISSYDKNAMELHELYKQRSTSEFCDERVQSKLVLNWRAKKQNLHSKTWIEQVKGHVMAGSTLTDDFRANDILWQLFQKSRAEWSLLQLCRDEEIISEAN